MSYLQNIAAFSSDNLGSLLEIRVARRADVQSIPAPSYGVVYGDIVLKPGKSWAQWSVTRNTPRHRSAFQASMEGDFESASLSFTIPRDRAAIRPMLQMAQDDDHIVLYRDANSEWKLYGSLSDPVRFRFSHDTGSAPVQRNAYACEFYSEGSANTWFYNGEVSAPPSGTPPAIVRFSNGQIVAALQPGETLIITSGFSVGFRLE